MAYPSSIDQFTQKLNKNDTGYVIEDEVLTLANGVYEGVLAHDNINDGSVMVFTGPKMSGERVENFFLSIPSDSPWKRIIKVFSSEQVVYVTYETNGDQVEAEDVNRLQDSLMNTQGEVERYKAENEQTVSNIGMRLATAENNKAEKTYVDTELLKKADKSKTYTKIETDTRIQELIGAAPEALDTLQEIADALNNDPDFAATMTNELSTKVDKVAGKQLSTEDYSTSEKTKLAGIEGGANKYIHPSSHPASMIDQDSAHRFVTDTEKNTWNDKETPAGAQAKADTAESNSKAYADSITPTKLSQLTNDKGYITASGAPVQSVNGKTGVVSLTAANIGAAPSDHEHDSSYLSKVNTTSYTPTSFYHPATKKYVDDKTTGLGTGDMRKEVYDTNNDGIVDKAKVVIGPVTWNNLKGV